MAANLDGEFVLCSVKSHKEIGNSKVLTNFIGNLLYGSIVGRISDDFILSLTKEHLYIEAYWYSTWGGLPEKLYTEKYSREDIHGFDVKEEDDKEIIEIMPKDKKKMVFIRNNDKEDNLANEMKKLFFEEFNED